MSRCLITGGAGFIGSHVAEHLRDAGHEVVVLDDLSGGDLRNVPDRVQFIKGSICDAQIVDHVFRTREPQYVWHLAAYAAEGLSPFIRGFNYTNNLVGSANIISACVNYGVHCLVFTSSIAVYGDSERLPFQESYTPRPIDPYGIAKYAVELDLEAAHEQFGLEYIIFRPHNCFGPRQNIADRYRNVVGIFMNQLMRGEPMTIFGDGNQQRAFSYIDDVAPVIADAVNKTSLARNLTFNIGGDTWYSVTDLAVRVARAMGVAPQIVHLPTRHEATRAYCDHTLVKRWLDFRDTTPLDEGLARMAAWAQARGPQVSTPFAAIEIEKGLPESWRDKIKQP